MATKRMFYPTATILLLQVFSWSFAWAQATRLNVGYSAASADQLPAWVAKDSGIFAKNGLDVDLIFFTGGTTAILALVSGDVPITRYPARHWLIAPSRDRKPCLSPPG